MWERFFASPFPSGLFILIMFEMKMIYAGHFKNCIAIKSNATPWLNGTQKENKVSEGI